MASARSNTGNNQPERSLGRPKDMAKHAAILDSARKHFLENGYAGASMDAIANEASVSKLTVYSHFNSKEELFRRFIVSECEQHADLMDHQHLLKLDIRAALELFGSSYIDAVYTNDAFAFYRLLVIEGSQNPKLSRIFHENCSKNMREQFSLYLTALIKQGKLRIPDTHSATGHFLTLLKGDSYNLMLLNIIDKPTPQQLKAHLEEVLTIFLNAYQAK